MSIEEENIQNLLKQIKDVSEADGIKEIESLADKVITETKTQKSQKDISVFSFLDSEKIKDEHKIVSQLDDVTKESEEKATELFDIMNDVSDDLMQMASKYEDTKIFLNDLKASLNSGASKEDIVAQIDEHSLLIQRMDKIKAHADSILFEGMSLMQYQDINRQRIERVINVIRTLIRYLNLLFEGRKDDINRTSSAKHLAGDKHKEEGGTAEEVIDSNDDIENLIKQFNQIDKD